MHIFTSSSVKLRIVTERDDIFHCHYQREGNVSGSKGSGSTTSTSGHHQEGPRTRDAKTLRRLAQNREAARKSRLRKKVP
jgi:hypothetical protein